MPIMLINLLWDKEIDFKELIIKTFLHQLSKVYILSALEYYEIFLPQ